MAHITRISQFDDVDELSIWCKEMVELRSLDRPDLGGERYRRLSERLATGGIIRVLQVHDPLSALIAENTILDVDGIPREFDAMWSSSLSDSTLRGKPDIECVDISSRMHAVSEIFDVTRKPLIFDGDTGGRPEHFHYTVRSLERLGVSAVIIEDKVGLKRNSLFGPEADQQQDSIPEFCRKIETGLRARRNAEFLIFARCESLVLEVGMQDAIERCRAYLSAGADGILIHSRSNKPMEILAFAEQYNRFSNGRPLIVVPTAYSMVYEHDLVEAGVRIVIYANHMLRAAVPNMVKVARSILEHGRCHEASDLCLPIGTILNLIPEAVR